MLIEVLFVMVFIWLYVCDNVVVVCVVFVQGVVVMCFDVVLLIVGMFVVFGYKIVLWVIVVGEVVLKYGQFIGVVSWFIVVGEYVYVYNVEIGNVLLLWVVDSVVMVQVVLGQVVIFEGYVCVDGCVGMCNYIGVVLLVNCLVSVCKGIVCVFEDVGVLFGIDGVVVIMYGSGCGMSDGEGLVLLCCMLCGYVMYFNFVVVLVIGLGCEVNQVVVLFDGIEIGCCVYGLIIQVEGGMCEIVECGWVLVCELVVVVVWEKCSIVFMFCFVVGL